MQIHPTSEHRMIEYESLAHSNRDYLPEIETAAVRVRRSGWYVLGQEVSALEAEFANYTGVKHCVGVANGLEALTLSIEAVCLLKGSDILVASNTYIATILATLRAGHNPVLVKPAIETFNMDPARLAESITSKTRAICVTHLCGKSCRMDAIYPFTKEHGLRIIEDCAQSHGAKLFGRMTGTFGDADCFSFYPPKNLGAIGDAGAVVPDDDAIANRLWHVRNYGSRQKYINKYPGANSRLDEIQAAILRVELRHLDAMTEHKRTLAKKYILTSYPLCYGSPSCRMTNMMYFIFLGFAIVSEMSCVPGCYRTESKPKFILRFHHIENRPLQKC